jgi:hypothetical protein
MELAILFGTACGVVGVALGMQLAAEVHRYFPTYSDTQVQQFLASLVFEPHVPQYLRRKWLLYSLNGICFFACIFMTALIFGSLGFAMFSGFLLSYSIFRGVKDYLRIIRSDVKTKKEQEDRF